MRTYKAVKIVSKAILAECKAKNKHAALEKFIRNGLLYDGMWTVIAK